MIAQANSMVDKHPLGTGPLLLMLAAALLLLFGVGFLILKIRK
ncbi:MAG TPA: hypothetical protein VGI03_07635 [Verrucomicrobiae bacterium]|jgi:hypothetical protein